MFTFHHVFLHALGTALPVEEISSLEIERRLSPCYERLGLIPGRLELMTGIRARRHFPLGMRPSEIATSAARDLFAKSKFSPRDVDCLIYASVCRDFVEPATATVVHHNLGLSPGCLLFDLSNACLSGMNAIAVASGLIESGQAKAVLIVTGEDARNVVDKTIDALNRDTSLTRQSFKPSLASLTLGSGGVAMLLTREGGARVKSGAFHAATQFNALCVAEGESSMDTDSETMLHEGVALAVRTWRELRGSFDRIDRYFTHQVGGAHRALMQQKLELDPAKDFSTFEFLGNMGAASVGMTLALGARAGCLKEGDRVALLGIGSGLVCGMWGLQWSEAVTV